MAAINQNRSTAVMQRRNEPHDSLDDFPTPPWATRALCEHLVQTHDLMGMTCREPAANRGHMVDPLSEYFGQVFASDIHDYGAGYPVRDYLFDGDDDRYDWIITNPPFRLAQRFVEKALQQARTGVAMFVRTAFLEGIGRHAALFSDVPPTTVLQFAERVVIHRGKLAPKGSSATAYCWLVWDVTDAGTRLLRDPTPVYTRLRWIPPCRKQLERVGDYATGMRPTTITPQCPQERLV